jgi:3-phenylpropionate/trans-cinnamate dioxygenase ferredoxin reductase subunit
VIPERGNTWTLVLKPVGHPGMNFMPGQFAWITAWKSPFSDTEHPFSFSSSASKPDELAFTIKELGDFTSTIKTMKPGQKVYLDGPFGHFTVDRHLHARQFIFIAGGVGITPIMSILRTLADRGEKRPLTLIYANNEWESVIFREELEALKTALNLQVVHVLLKPPPGWSGETGFVTPLILEKYLPKGLPPNSFEVFICGPQGMMKAVEKALEKLGVPLGDFHSEGFALV